MNADLQIKIDDILEEMKMVYKNDKRPWVIGYSGGKDSTAVVQLVFTMLQNLPKTERHKDVFIVSSDTLIENPIVLGYLKHNSQLINEGARNTDIPLYTHMVHPDYDNTYWTNIIGKGLPTPTSIRFRWCTERLKIKPSNTFIEDKVKENGEVVVLLGVRKTESIARGIRIKRREIDGYLLTPHVTLDNTYVYNPIVELTTDDVWEVLLSNNGITPWGTSNNDLFALYAGGDGGECPFTTTNDKETPSCGNSRFGCWICTVVNKDKSLTGFIKSGESWLQPLLDFREWIISIRNRHEYRMQYRRDGNHYYKKLYIDKLPLLENYTIDPDYLFANENGEGYIDLKNCQSEMDKGNISPSDDKDKIYLDLLPLLSVNNTNDVKLDESKIQKDEKGTFVNVLGYGPFNFKGRKLILKKLLEIQKLINEEYEIELITKEELEVIDRIWDEEEDLTRRSLVDLYYEVTNERLPWDDYKKPMFDKTTRDEIEKLCTTLDIDQGLINKLLIETNKYKHFTNKSVLDKSINKILNARHLHKEIVEEIENDN
ncbi:MULTISPECIES: DNA phosphorothioation system sulfurtransferase DndC [Clostridium]|uniref:DNA phosphorothioation system sulfurtransferase DndC n=1 Tax=Clostridium TaxID=1485 RepID=UPI0011DE5802|nr:MULTISPECIES: DNA phosphorothioation system sulfurtransferase DndC [Clostridium]MDU1069685.1 DNA phosphorothioation system sulfurtransferase DndC [Clostridium sp.]MDU2677607.1 DNA phosphorothioation system sulfurtransferase DndC [Clostridium sp.]MDU4211761.1 DNA phosphorothioation system sulfurtransferase DndC [Clostridium sp.]MDU5174867.1 DNA phosphorothioation system sulfurtransferase DndC [Clostridium sp.]MDU7120589.1 DNA phosphorothioation system sulfurtransferase DndC [Clostridium sp.]